MGTRDKRVDAFIAKSEPFAQPILTHLREVMHAACPDVEEQIKWGMPSFEYHGILAGMASFKKHAAFGFWKGKLVTESAHKKDAMWGFGRITSVKDLPSKRELTALIKKAMKLNEAGVKQPRVAKHPKPPVRVPVDLAKSFVKSAKAKKFYATLSMPARREYVEWITGAKRAETRAERVKTAVTWMAEGKRFGWKYEKGSGRKT